MELRIFALIILVINFVLQAFSWVVDVFCWLEFCFVSMIILFVWVA